MASVSTLAVFTYNKYLKIGLSISLASCGVGSLVTPATSEEFSYPTLSTTSELQGLWLGYHRLLGNG